MSCQYGSNICKSAPSICLCALYSMNECETMCSMFYFHCTEDNGLCSIVIIIKFIGRRKLKKSCVPLPFSTVCVLCDVQEFVYIVICRSHIRLYIVLHMDEFLCYCDCDI